MSTVQVGFDVWDAVHMARKGGATLRVIRTAPPIAVVPATRGYCVARVRPAPVTVPWQWEDDWLAEEILRYVDAYAYVLTRHHAHLGLWHDHERGEIEISVTDVIIDRGGAMATARSRGERYIYDLDSGETIPVV